MSGELTQPKVDQYIHWLSRDDHFGMHGCVYDDKSDKLLDEFFELIEQIAPVSKNGVRRSGFARNAGPSRITATQRKKLPAVISIR